MRRTPLDNVIFSGYLQLYQRATSQSKMNDNRHNAPLPRHTIYKAVGSLTLRIFWEFSRTPEYITNMKPEIPDYGWIIFVIRVNRTDLFLLTWSGR